MRLNLNIDTNGNVTGSATEIGVAPLPPSRIGEPGRGEIHDNTNTNRAPAPVFRQPGHENETEERFRQRVERHENLNREQDRHAGEQYNGTSGLRADQLTASDLVYMDHARENAKYRLEKLGVKQIPNVYQALLVGSQDDINAALSYQNRTDVQQVRESFQQNGEEWVRAYASQNPALVRAYNTWIGEQEVAARAENAKVAAARR